LTPDEKVVQNIAKRARQQEAQDEMTELNWRSIDSKTECFLIDQLPPEKAFLTLNMRRRDASYLDIFRIFFTDSISSRLFESMSPEDTLLGYRKSGTPHHFDRQKGVGKKYNFSHGFKRYTDKRKISECKEMIPAYDYYKTFFECCDNFNRGLKDKHWPHKRGGKGTKGEYGNHNDFFLACILQNTFNSWCAVTNTDYKSITFQAFCDDLAEQIVLFSSKL
jgi:hypothetical protein